MGGANGHSIVILSIIVFVFISAFQRLILFTGLLASRRKAATENALQILAFL